MAETKLVGIVNVTPDSFSDGGVNYAPEAALAAIARLIEEGTDVIDIGAESTRPGAVPIDAQEEWRRLQPVLEGLPQGGVYSVDTRHAQTAKRALALGVDWINDVTGFADPAMVAAVAGADCRLVVMHSLGVPASREMVLPESADVVEEVLAFASARIAALEAAGIARGRMIFDPGIGFGKTLAQSLALLRGIARFEALGVALLVGHSRKSFLGAFGERDAATLCVSQWLSERGVDYLRVHDVAGHRRMLSLREALSDD